MPRLVICFYSYFVPNGTSLQNNIDVTLYLKISFLNPGRIAITLAQTVGANYTSSHEPVDKK
ncbi:MAG: hypothetical protein HYV28_10535 [Ignavibacteriales bacterium]|nr:hypothetical protein [Ignavibacteriales bacterium]